LVQSIDRGDVAEFSLRPWLAVGSTVAVGDTIGSLRSTWSDVRLAELTGAVDVAVGERQALQAGEKQTLIDEASARLARIQELIALQERILERTRTLNTDRLATDDELDLARSELASLEGEAEIIRAQVAVLESGARPEDVRLASARLDAARRQLEALASQRADLAIRTPVSGVVTRAAGDSVFVTVLDTSAWVVVLPVPVEARAILQVGQAVTVEGDFTDQAVEATIHSIDPVVNRLVGDAVVMVTVVIESPLARPIEGLLVRGSIQRPPITLRTLVTEKIASILSWQLWFGNAPRD
jgi:HlyD family secretion protein